MGTDVMLQPRKLTRHNGSPPLYQGGVTYHKIHNGMPYFKGGVPYYIGDLLAKMLEGEWMSLPQMHKLLSDDRYRNKITVPLAVASFLAYPPANDVFRAAKDITDPKTGWNIRQSAVEQLHETERSAGRVGIFEVPNIAIYVSFKSACRADGKVVIEAPETIGVIYNVVSELRKGAKVNMFGVDVEPCLPPSDGVTVGPLVLGFDMLAGDYRRKVSIASNPDSIYALPFTVSLNKLMAKTQGAAEKLLADATATASGLIIATRDASEQILAKWYLRKKAA